jgi:hypothetical protein
LERKTAVHELIDRLVLEVLAFIREAEKSFDDGWVPASYVKNKLDLDFVSVPQASIQYGRKGMAICDPRKVA